MTVPAPTLRSGFTLIEMVVVVGIMGILLMVGVASYGKMNDRAKVEQAAISTSTQLRTWQKQVESGIGSNACGATEAFGGFRISWVGGNSRSIQAKIICGVAETANPPKVFTIPNDCIVEEFPSFVIRPVGLGILPPTDITIVNPKIATISYTVFLSGSGGIDVKKD